MINPRQKGKPAALTDEEMLERKWSGSFPLTTGRSEILPRLVAGLRSLQHAYRLSDVGAVARWIDNPYHQHFTVDTLFPHRPPIDPSLLTGWRKHIGVGCVEWTLTQSIQAVWSAGSIEEGSAKRVAVDTTVMENTIVHPTDDRLY